MASASPSGQYLVNPLVDVGCVWIYPFAAFLIRFTYDGFMFSIGVFHESLYEYFGASSAATSLVSSVLFGMAFITAPFATVLVNRFDCRRVSMSGALIATTGLLISLAVPRIEYLYFTIGFFCGFGIGLMDFSAVAIIGNHFDKKRATAMGLSFSGSGFGSLFIAPLMGWLTRYYGFWKGAILIAAGLLLNCVVFSLFYNEKFINEKKEAAKANQRTLTTSDNGSTGNDNGPSTSDDNTVSRSTQTEDDSLIQKQKKLKENTAQKSETQGTTRGAAFQEQSRSIRFRDALQELIDFSVFKQYIYIMFNLACFIFSLGIRMPFVYVSHRATELGIATPGEANFLVSIIGISNTFGRLAFGAWADKTSLRRLNIFNAILIINGLANFTISLLTQYYQLAIYCSLYGITFGGVTMLIPIVLVDLFGVQKLNTCYGLLGFTSGIAIAFGTPLTGMIYDYTKSYEYGFYACGGLVVTSCSLLALIPIVQKRCPQ